MAFGTPGPNRVPRSNAKPRNVYHIGGIQVEFPYQPYGTQLAFMSRVISTLDRAQRDGHCHALLESPTGTGKSLSLLCSVLAWQNKYKLTSPNASLSHSKAAPEALTDPLGHGGGFIPETQPSDPDPAQAASNKRPKSKRIPTIYYASRTHSQLSQVIREYRKTTYRVPMAVLASRKHYCTNPNVQGKENVDEECKLLLKDKGNIRCREFNNVQKVMGHPSLRLGGCHDVHDIEDLVKVGQSVRGCPYHAARNMSDNAQLIFCPYNYIVNPVIRGAMEVDVRGAIIILDEAHNMEDVARDSGSIDIEEDTLFKLQAELEQLTCVNAMIYQPLCEMIQGLISWMEQRKSTLEKREFQHYFSCWTGNKALRELQESNISRQCFPTLLDCATKAIRIASDSESDAPHLSGMAVTVLEGLFSSLTYFFSRDGSHMFDYQLALQQVFKRDSKNSSGSWRRTFSLWCLNPAVVFKEIADLSLSIILTSGTLSPMTSFSSELGIQFDTCLEAPHVIDVGSQVWAAAISTGPGNYPLNASYKTADAYMFQDALGKALERICSIVPGGSLVFFPSYKLMEKLCSHWRETGQWSQLNLRKSLYVEPRGNQEEFEPFLKSYYNAISAGRKPAAGRKRSARKTGVDSAQNPKDIKGGAAFLAVCRGKMLRNYISSVKGVVFDLNKIAANFRTPEVDMAFEVSEGIDFSDENARVVIVVGIPFPNINDIQVGLKKKYNDMYKTSKSLVSGSEWYCQQAFRALNQAAGRCIRHRFDYGAIILLDERYREERNKTYISKWLRQSIKQYEDFDMAMEGLKTFFTDVKERVNKAMVTNQECSTIEDKMETTNHSDSLTSKKSHKQTQAGAEGGNSKNVVDLHHREVFEANNFSVTGSKVLLKQREQNLRHCHNSEQNYVSNTKCRATTQLQSEGYIHAQTPVVIEENVRDRKDNPDLECSSLANSRCCEMSSMTFSCEDPDIAIVEETAILMECASTSPCSVSKNGSSSPNIVQVFESPDKLYFPHVSSADLRKDASRAESSLIVTPEKGVTRKFMPDLEPSLSVCSLPQKRRISCSSTSIDLVEIDKSDFLGTHSDSMSFTRRIDFGSESICLKPKFGSSPSSHPGMDEDEVIKISCKLCRSPLGLSRNHHYVKCLLSSSSKIHLISLLEETAGPLQSSRRTRVSVLIADSSLVDPRLYKKNTEGAVGQGIWCQQDGCVFNNVHCPFCPSPTNCLGVQVMATDSSNAHLLDKMLFYLDRLDIHNPTAEGKELQKDQLPARDPPVLSKSDVMRAIDRFVYSPRQQGPGGWRTTKSKLRLPKRSQVTDGNG